MKSYMKNFVHFHNMKFLFYFIIFILCFHTHSLWAQQKLTPSYEKSEVSLRHLYQRVAKDANAGLPIVVQVHVALCDNSLIRCGAQGNGDDIHRNLYWTTSEGLVGWMKVQGKRQGWFEIYQGKDTNPAVLQVRIYQKQVNPNSNWKNYGLTKPFSLYLVAYAWRGKSIDLALESFFKDVFQNRPKLIDLSQQEEVNTQSASRVQWENKFQKKKLILSAGGAAHLVAWVGHNRLMDLEPMNFSEFYSAAESQGASHVLPKGFMMMACHSASYVAKALSSSSRVPLLLTKDFVFASAPALEGSLRAFAQADDLKQILEQGALGYAVGEEKPVSLAKKVITNPADPKWKW